MGAVRRLEPAPILADPEGIEPPARGLGVYPGTFPEVLRARIDRIPLPYGAAFWTATPHRVAVSMSGSAVRLSRVSRLCVQDLHRPPAGHGLLKCRVFRVVQMDKLEPVQAEQLKAALH